MVRSVISEIMSSSVKLMLRRITSSPSTIIIFVTSVLLLAWVFESVHRSAVQQREHEQLLKQLQERDRNAHAKALDNIVISSDCKAIAPADDGSTSDPHHIPKYRAISSDHITGLIQEEVDFARVLLHYSKTVLKVLSKRTLPRQLGITSELTTPNVVHYFWPTGKDFSFLNYLSLLSVERSLSPQYIVIHSSRIPSGQWWDQVLEDVPNIVLLRKDPPSKLNGITIHDHAIATDLARMETILDYGGIVLDPDVLVLQPLDDYRRLSFIIGHGNSPDLLSLSVMIGHRGNPFLRLLMEGYHSALHSGKDSAYIAKLPHYLSVMFPNLLRIEDQTFKLRTDNLAVLLSIHIDWHKLHVIRFTEGTHQMPQHPDEIKLMDSTAGEIMRHVYFGDKEKIRH